MIIMIRIIIIIIIIIEELTIANNYLPEFRCIRPSISPLFI